MLDYGQKIFCSGTLWLNKSRPMSVTSINFISNVGFSFWQERNLSIVKKGSAMGLLASFWAKKLPTQKAASPASTFRLSCMDGMWEKQHHHCGQCLWPAVGMGKVSWHQKQPEGWKWHPRDVPERETAALSGPWGRGRRLPSLRRPCQGGEAWKEVGLGDVGACWATTEPGAEADGRTRHGRRLDRAGPPHTA